MKDIQVDDHNPAKPKSGALSSSAAGVPEARSVPLNRQQWSCDKCLRNGAAWLEAEEAAWSAVSKLADEHRRVSPNCDATLHELRVIFG